MATTPTRNEIIIVLAQGGTFTVAGSPSTDLDAISGANVTWAAVNWPSSGGGGTTTANQGTAGSTPWPTTTRGVDAEGVAPTVNPVYVAVKNANGVITAPKIDISGNLVTANPAGSQEDGHSGTLGSTGDGAVQSNTTGTISGKLRGIIKWAYERMPASLGQKTMSVSLPVALASDQSAVSVSAASLPLPSGAATAAKQPALGTAGTASADVISVQGVAGGTKLSVEQQTYTAPFSGELAGSTSAAQAPNLACKLIKVKAQGANSGKVYIGASGVTKPNGTTDTTTGLELQPGDETGWLPVDNFNRLYYISENAGDALTYLGLV